LAVTHSWVRESMICLNLPKIDDSCRLVVGLSGLSRCSPCYETR